MEPLTDLNPRLKEGTMLVNIAPLNLEEPCDFIRLNRIYVVIEINELTGTLTLADSLGNCLELHRNYISSKHFKIV
ncbi:MAG: hypothetical protein UV74_C0013G0026 [Candidatus Woesebacteria bacterium GW2011_GWB1_43_14]|uniref:Uncharacterized protein n=1 Tax=Candidatus Woesebacteria bacterium GW2011_GWB1_43_14 TaxID=1618578 RepID=A0A0G1DGT4_9BACT|nr:MAG: hypothetical protein UV74_C0013G0026 [Candidatus Woesebacteria bacterium GW2011_GWB1_43_14]